MSVTHTATDEASLETAIATAIQAITPRLTEGQDAGWIWEEGNRDVPTAIAHRAFTIQWGNPVDVLSVFGAPDKHAQGVEVSIVTHYRNIRRERLGIHLNADIRDLWKCLHDNTEIRGGANEIAGLIMVETTRTFTDLGDGVWSHDFTIPFLTTR